VMEAFRFSLERSALGFVGISPPWGLWIFKALGSTDPMCFLKSAEARPPRSGHRLDEPTRLSLGMVASQQSPLPFPLADSL